MNLTKVSVTDQRQEWQSRFTQAVTALSPQTVRGFLESYAVNAVFEDPFQRVTGRQAISMAYLKMFENLHAPQFTNLQFAWVSDSYLAARWLFSFRRKPASPQRTIWGTSWLTLDTEFGLIAQHEDHWDASELFAAFPGLGVAIPWLKSRVAHPISVTPKP